MTERVSPDDPLPTRTEVGEETVDLPEGTGFFNTGQVLGDRYEILEMLGRGGMGEVWRAFDLKLRVEVGLKALREGLFQTEGRREMLRQEVRAAREVVSPNVCRIFDLIEINGRELVSMEFVDGATLLGVLQERGPTELKEAQDIASQFLSGLEAIHKAGLVHRDVKPENIMLTRAGRVVVMDFGLARGPESGAGSVSGTPAYMAPEHAAGQEVDARADVYSAGVVLAEMVSPEGIKSYESRQSVWEGVRSEPAEVPDSPWAPVIQRAVARDRERRQNSAHTLIRELEDVTLRVEGAEDLHPFPGLAAFTEEDAEYFFGREAEIEAMWRRLDGPPRLFALVGPSGAGKSSFIRAGIAAHAPRNWRIIRSTPGNAAVASLAAVVARETAGDPDTVALLPQFDTEDVAVEVLLRWSRQSTHSLLVVDQFEELFTQNSDDEQRRFARLLERFVLEADVHVLLVMRDDFVASCNTHEPLRPIFHELTVLDPLSGGNLRRALVRPAAKCGYRFEDDGLVEEILVEVEGERGALPLLAFALARLWEKRDRDAGLLTRRAYHDIGGVGGALARHAEATVDRIGVERIPIVRELFRNLVTAEGTRAVREWDELLSVFERTSREGIKPSPTKNADHDLVGAGFTPARDAASGVLAELIDARLLTSYEIREDEHDPIRRVEIIHESLLANWPRLVRWQTQDQEGAHLREELRQSARSWDEHGRHDDRLWTGTAYREFELWRERYPGGLTDVEESFGAAMTSLATRRKRRRRLAVTGAFVLLLAALTVFGSLWQRGIRETRRAEAQKLIMMGDARMEDYPTASLAYATQSLEMADTEEARFLALGALWEGPAAFVVNDLPTRGATFSPGGRWLVQTHDVMSSLAIISREGEQTVMDHPTDSGTTRCYAGFGGHADYFISWGTASDWGRIALWSALEKRMLVTARPVDRPEYYGAYGGLAADAANPRAFLLSAEDDRLIVTAIDVRGSVTRLGTLPIDFRTQGNICAPRASQDWIGVFEGNDVSIIKCGGESLADRIPLGRHEGGPGDCRADPLGRTLATWTQAGEIRIWDVTGESPPTTIQGPPTIDTIRFSTDGNFLLAQSPATEDGHSDVWIWSVEGLRLTLRRRFTKSDAPGPILDPEGLKLASPSTTGPVEASTNVWSLGWPEGTEPVVIRRGDAIMATCLAFSPDGRWLATGDGNGLALWPTTGLYPAVIATGSSVVAFGPKGRSLVTAERGRIIRVPLDGSIPAPGHTISGTGFPWGIEMSPNGRLIALGGPRTLVIVRDDETEPQVIETNERQGFMEIAISPDSRLVAALNGIRDLKQAVFRVWEVETGREVAVLGLPEDELRIGSAFTANGRLLTGSSKGVLAWDIATGEHEVLVEADVAGFAASADGRRLLIVEMGEGGINQDPADCPIFYDLDAGIETRLETHGLRVWSMALSRDGSVVATVDRDGLIRVGPVTGEEPHLVGHGGWNRVTIDPTNRWIATGGGGVSLWPMPDLSKPLFHTLPREELIAKLKTLTNIRVVRDSESSTGWALTHGPFQGWETVPTW